MSAGTARRPGGSFDYWDSAPRPPSCLLSTWASDERVGGMSQGAPLPARRFALPERVRRSCSSHQAGLEDPESVRGLWRTEEWMANGPARSKRVWPPASWWDSTPPPWYPSGPACPEGLTDPVNCWWARRHHRAARRDHSAAIIFTATPMLQSRWPGQRCCGWSLGRRRHRRCDRRGHLRI